VGNLGMLGFFKYFNFFSGNYNALVELLGLSSWTLKYMVTIGLPLGISFYTFQSMSYTIDIYRGTVTMTRHPVNFACFVTMFPQLVAGPIVRYRDVARELEKRHVLPADFAAGVRLFIIGLGKKVLVANILAEPADRIFAIPADQLPMGVAWLGALFFPLQLYFDFSGYSDMAIGMGRMFGFHFPRNFNYPYICTNAADFWQRWHMTLSNWLRDYVFVPLGGYRKGRRRAYFNLVFTFFLCGLWHGASWNFILFGVIPGALMVVERMIHANRRKFFNSWMTHVFYTLPFIFVCMVIFRTETLGHAGRYMRAMAGLAPEISMQYTAGYFVNPEIFVIALAGILGSMPFIPWLAKHIERMKIRYEGRPISIWIEGIQQSVIYMALCAMLLLCAMKLAAGTYNPFIYFRF
jgi:alginate O-acetyltransferase complex protein AlgI